MAAKCMRVLTTTLRKSLTSGFLTSNGVQKLPVKNFHHRLTWSQLRHWHSGSSVPSSAVILRSSRYGWRWTAFLATAGLTQGFLGFSLGKKDEEKKGDPLMRVYREAKEAHIKQDFHKAEILYHDALKVADEMLKLKKVNHKTYLYAKTNIYDSLADMALGQGQLEKAERLYKETMKGCLQQGVSQDDNAMVELSLKLATIYAMLGRGKEAEQGLLFCIKSQDSKLASGKEVVPVSDVVKEVSASAKADSSGVASAEKKEDLNTEFDEEEKRRDTESLLGMALETYGRFLMGERRLTEAVQALERATTIAGKVLGMEKQQYIILVNDLATAHILLKNYEKATEILNKAIESATKMKSSHLPVLYCNLGAVFLRTAKLQEAEEACAKGQELSKHNQHSMGASMSQKCLEKIAQVKAAV